MVSRMTDQKGFDLISYMLEEMLSSGDFQFVFLGTGEGKYEEMLRYFVYRWVFGIRRHEKSGGGYDSKQHGRCYRLQRR